MSVSGYIEIQVITTHLLFRHLQNAQPSAQTDAISLKRVNAISAADYLNDFIYVGKPYGWTGRLLLSDAELNEVIQSPNFCLFHILGKNGEFAGLAEFYIHSDSLVHLNYFGLTTNFQGKGLGLLALQMATNEMLKIQKTDIYLHTCEFDHKAALHVYQKAGFEITNETLENAYYTKEFLQEYMKAATPNQHIQRIRKIMGFQKFDALMVLSADPHNSEYLPVHWAVRAWLSGFTGSAGTLVVTQNFAGVWTDSRYFIQAEKELAGTDIQLMKLKIPHTPEFLSWISENLEEKSIVSTDGRMIMVSQYRAYAKMLEKKNILLNIQSRIPETFWLNRPEVPEGEIFIHPENFSGKDTSQKIQEIQKWLSDNNAKALLVCALDEIAYILNLRGNDIVYNPVFLSYLLIAQDKTVLFTYTHKLSEDAAKSLHSNNIQLEHYNHIIPYLKSINDFKNIHTDLSKLNMHIFDECRNLEWTHVLSPVGVMKALKNQTEIQNYHNAMARDGVAITQFGIWLEKNWNTSLNEFDAATILRNFRSNQAFFVSESFETISSFGANGAIVHYAPSSTHSANFENEGVYLLDSGAQYFDGTTDITRMFFKGNISDEVKKHYTLVLKGHIQLASIHFPKGTIGYQLDVLARSALWMQGKDYGHGTGHGVGYFLNVHEGPQAIRQIATETNIALQLGMVLSIEPGYYEQGKYGIRVENLYVVAQSELNENFLKFSPLTLAHIETEQIDCKLLTPNEITWLNQYHSLVIQKLSPLLSPEEIKWLTNKAKPL